MSNLDPTTEIAVVQKDTFKTIHTAVNKLVEFVKPTFGPAGNKVIISKSTHKGVFDDGVQIARDFELQDPTENAIINIIRETAIKTNDRVGDGTTGSLLMLQAIINKVAEMKEFDGRKIELELLQGLKEVKEQLLKSAKPIKTKEELKKVALISFDNEKIAEMIAELYFKLGKDGIITIDKSQTMEVESEMSEGVKLPRGYISPYMITNAERMEAVIEKPYILITDYRLTEINDILPIMNKMAAENKRELVVICDNMEQGALATAIVNKVQNKFYVLAINAPQGDNRKILLEDLAILTGAKVFSESKGDKLEMAEIKDLGRAERIVCKREESIFIKPKGVKTEVSSAVLSLKMAIGSEKNEKARGELQKRLAMFTNTLAVIKVGALTENEQKALKYKVEDAVNAVKAAYVNGVVCGAGVALAECKTSSELLNEALQYPARQVRENSGKVFPSVKEGDVWNLATEKTGNFMDVGVIDPVDVLIAGVESAVSIAALLLTSSGIIVEYPKPKE